MPAVIQNRHVHRKIIDARQGLRRQGFAHGTGRDRSTFLHGQYPRAGRECMVGIMR